ncbi:unnamed protein product [Oncorhynchus mykiss]|uniref:PDZ domain-containing protein n=1 Tax=Oncorhynchus mykiss TaxID=8022 RepID=A0A060Z818_ONCMY|nr:unnamed protein product [Oncorhynchus mykiss]
MPDSHAVQVPMRRDHTVADVVSLACKLTQLNPNLHCLRLHRCVAQNVEVRTPAPSELLHDLLYDELEVFPMNVFTLHMTRPACTGDFGFAVTGHIDGQRNSRIFVSEVLPDGLAFSEGLRPGNEIVVLNGRGVSTLDLGLIQKLFAEQTLQLTLRRDAPPTSPLTSDPSTPTPLSNQSQLLQDFLDTHHHAKSTTGEIVHPHTHTNTHTKTHEHTHNTVSSPKGW